MLLVLFLSFFAVLGSHIEKGSEQDAKNLRSMQHSPLKSTKNPQDTEIVDLYKRNLSKSQLPRFLNLLKRNHPKPENVPETFLKLITDFAKGIDVDKIEMFMVVYYFHDLLKTHSSKPGQNPLMSNSVLNLELLYWMFLQPHGSVDSDLQTPNQLLHDLYAAYIPSIGGLHLPQESILLMFETPFNDLKHYKELPLAFFMLAAAFDPSFITVDFINNLSLSGTIQNPDYLDDIFVLKFLGAEYLQKSQAEMDRRFFNKIQPFLLDEVFTDELVYEIYAYISFYSQQVPKNAPVLNERQLLIVKGLLSLIKIYNRHFVLKNVPVIKVGSKKIQEKFSSIKRSEDSIGYLTLKMKDFQGGEFDLAMILSICKNFRQEGGTLPDHVVKRFIEKVEVRVRPNLAVFAKDILLARQDIEEVMAGNQDDSGNFMKTFNLGEVLTEDVQKKNKYDTDDEEKFSSEDGSLFLETKVKNP
jgi:hypothetical protein